MNILWIEKLKFAGLIIVKVYWAFYKPMFSGSLLFSGSSWSLSDLLIVSLGSSTGPNSSKVVTGSAASVGSVIIPSGISMSKVSIGSGTSTVSVGSKVSIGSVVSSVLSSSISSIPFSQSSWSPFER